MPRKQKRHKPQRTCVGCREVLAKHSLVRIVRAPDGVRVDPSGKAPGRGAYLHPILACWKQAMKGSLSRALRTEITPETREQLMAYVNDLKNDKLD